MNSYMGFIPPQPCMRMGGNQQMVKPMMEMQLARAYVPLQPYIGMLPLSEALKKGVLFPNLDIPYPIKQKE